MNFKLTSQIGEIVSWVAPHSVAFGTLQAAMTHCNLPQSLALDMRPSNAWRRAVHHLTENRVIRETYSDEDVIRFQFTSEYLDITEFKYTKECDLSLDKKSGIVTCTDYGVEQRAQHLINTEMQKRNANDVTRIIQKLFRQASDLIPIRQQGGVYFVPESASDVPDRVAHFLRQIGGSIQRFEISGDGKSGESVATSIRDVIYKMVDEAHESVTLLSTLTDEDNDRQQEKTLANISAAQAKLDAYRDLLQDYTTDVEDALSQVRDGLQKALGLHDDVTDEEPVSVDDTVVEESFEVAGEFVEEEATSTKQRTIDEVLALFK